MKILKSFCCLFSIMVSILILIPFSLTQLFTPQFSDQPDSPPKDTGNAVHAAVPVEKERLPQQIRVFRTDSRNIDSVPFEEYVKGVTSSEMPAEFHIEALKAQAVAARTYSMAKIQQAEKNGYPAAHSDAPVCDSVHCQVYQDQSDLTKRKGKTWMNTGWKKICRAVDATEGKLLYYDGALLQQALFHSSSGGKTENCEDVFASAVPYLVSVDSPYEKEATHKKETLTLSLSDFASKIKKACPTTSFGLITGSNIKVLSRSTGDRVEKIQIGSGVLTGRQVREALSLYSANFTVSTAEDSITFTTAGSGHGVGMSQYGADGMAKQGYPYEEILSHYYKGTTVAPGDFPSKDTR